MPKVSLLLATDCGVRSWRSKRQITGMAASAMPAATTQSQRQSTQPMAFTKIRGKQASAKAKPMVAIDSALPLDAENQRAMATVAIWLVMPCPVKRRARMTRGNAQTIVTGSTAMATHASASRGRIAAVRARARNLSVKPPAHSINRALAVVPRV